MLKPSASDYAKNADNTQWIGVPYEVWDCQEFVEQMLRTVGIKENWKGSNDMWRNAVDGRFHIGDSPLLPGMWLFTIKNDGGEKERGYNDSMGNAAHVGIYLGNDRVIHSTTGGVQWDDVNSPRWTHAARCKLLDYDTESSNRFSGREALEDFLYYLIGKTLDEFDEWWQENAN